MNLSDFLRPLTAGAGEEEEAKGSGRKGPGGAMLRFLEEEGDRKVRNPDTGNLVKVKSLKGEKGQVLQRKLYEQWVEKDKGKPKTKEAPAKNEKQEPASSRLKGLKSDTTKLIDKIPTKYVDKNTQVPAAKKLQDHLEGLPDDEFNAVFNAVSKAKHEVLGEQSGKPLQSGGDPLLNQLTTALRALQDANDARRSKPKTKEAPAKNEKQEPASSRLKGLKSDTTKLIDKIPTKHVDKNTQVPAAKKLQDHLEGLPDDEFNAVFNAVSKAKHEVLGEQSGKPLQSGGDPLLNQLTTAFRAIQDANDARRSKKKAYTDRIAQMRMTWAKARSLR